MPNPAAARTGGPEVSGRRVVLHVGLPKTGTSFLQGVLRENADPLAGHGVLVPDHDGRQVFLSTLHVTGRSARWGRSDAVGRAAWEGVREAVRAHDGTSVVSNELLCLATREQAEHVLAELGTDDVHLVVTLRDLARQLPAEWQEGVKHGRRMPWRAFLEATLDDPSGLDPAARRLRARFWSAQDPLDVLDRWAGRLPAERVHVVTGPPPGAAPDELWRRFAQVLDVPPEAVQLPQRQVNASLGMAQTEVLRSVNKRFPRRGQERVYGDVVKRLYASEILRRQAGERVVLPPARRDDVRAEGERWAAGIVARGHHVIGDLDELLPPSGGPTEVAEPADLSDAQLLDVSLDATGDLLREVARLSAENERLRGRAEGKAAVPGSLRDSMRRARRRLRPGVGSP